MFSGAIEKQHQVVMGETYKANLGITIYKRAHITVEPKRLLVLQFYNMSFLYVLQFPPRFSPTRFESKIVSPPPLHFATPQRNFKVWSPLFLWFPHRFIIFKFSPLKIFNLYNTVCC